MRSFVKSLIIFFLHYNVLYPLTMELHRVIVEYAKINKNLFLLYMFYFSTSLLSHIVQELYEKAKGNSTLLINFHKY